MTETSNGLAFTTSARTRKTITFTLDGDEYEFTPPPFTSLVLPALDGNELEVFRGMMDWLGGGLPDDQEKRLEGRLRDPEDNLDIEDMFEIFQGLVGKVAGRPTPASSGS